MTVMYQSVYPHEVDQSMSELMKTRTAYIHAPVEEVWRALTDPTLTGFSLIEADSLDEAVQKAKSWPAGGDIEVRPVLEPRPESI